MKSMIDLVQPIKKVESYLYALCVLDFSNIAIPQSRLEIFTHAMITGVVPELEPQTREEVYMVAIIKGDVANLPTPKSRADHLLYRICLGETEIRDIELETRYEMLLAYLAEHGGTDLEHALINYTKAFETLYNTVEMPVESAILKGSTKYLDIDTGDILDAFDESKNLELVSVKMPVLSTAGKNLYDRTSITKNVTLSSETGLESLNNKRFSTDFIFVENMESVTVSVPSLTLMKNIWGYDRHKNPLIKITENGYANEKTIEIPNDVYYIRVPFGHINEEVITDEFISSNDIQIEEGTQATTYEPYKSNILSTSEDVELRGIGDVQDELNLMTGELTQRIGEVVLDGSEGWKLATTKDNTQVFTLDANNPIVKNIAKNSILMCDKLKVASGVDDEIINLTSSLYIALLKSKASTVEELKVYLSQNPITFIHELVAVSVKTVVLTVTDQNDQPTKLKTFNDVTYVETQADSVLPTVILEYGTKNEEVLSTLSSEQSEVAEAQTILSNAIDVQAEEVDSVMDAMSEIKGEKE